MTQSASQMSFQFDRSRPGTTAESSASETETPSSPQLSKQSFDRIFVPLSTKPYEWFQSGRKAWELRKCARQFTTDHVRIGRTVELRLGYSRSDRSLWGHIVEVITAETLNKFFDKVDWKDVLPESADRQDAESMARQILRLDEDDQRPVIGFRIRLEDNHAASSKE